VLGYQGGLPFDDGSVQGIFTEHCLEHLTLEECRKVLREFRRILKKGGIARIVVPDGELYANLYLDSKSGKEVHFPNADRMVESRPGGADLKTPMFYLNDIFCNYGHKFTFDAQTLVVLLQEAGFKDMQKEGFMRGRDKKLLIDRIRRKEESLYIEAVA
jgi:ubiquinone/menaquinone biosynthesis C-methylase UbiE